MSITLRFQQKNTLIKILILSSIITLLVLITILIYINFINPINRTETAEFNSEILNLVKGKGGSSGAIENFEEVSQILADTKKSPDEKYQALTNLSFYLSSEYTATKDPSIRTFSKNVVGKYAKDNFPDLYRDSDFNIPCSDPECGQELDPEIKKIINTLVNSKVDPVVIDVISRNLTTAGHVPDSAFDNKRSGFSISYYQMIEANNSVASKAASMLKSFAKNKYSMNL